MKLYSVEEIHSRFAALNFQIPDFHIVGIRSKDDIPDNFNDLIVLIYKIDGQWVCHYYTGTTHAGVHWLQNPLNSNGTAVMKSDQQCFNAYQLGKHKGLYEALVQVRPIYFYRDNDKDNKAEEQGLLEHTLIGANIHHANKDITSVIIGKWSAACQVLNNPKDFSQLLKICKESGQRFFTYSLLKEW